MRPYALRVVGVALALVAGCGPGASSSPPPSEAPELRLSVVGT